MSAPTMIVLLSIGLGVGIVLLIVGAVEEAFLVRPRQEMKKRRDAMRRAMAEMDAKNA